MFLGLGSLQLLIYHGAEPCYDFYSPFFYVLFYYLLPVIIFTHLFFVIVLCLFPLSFVPALPPYIQSGVSRL